MKDRLEIINSPETKQRIKEYLIGQITDERISHEIYLLINTLIVHRNSLFLSIENGEESHADYFREEIKRIEDLLGIVPDDTP